MSFSLSILAVVCFVSLISVEVSARSITMMASKYLGKSPIFVAGGSSGVGLQIVKQLAQLGTPVHALVRREVWKGISTPVAPYSKRDVPSRLYKSVSTPIRRNQS